MKKNAPEYCEVIIVHGGKRILESDQQVAEVVPSPPPPSRKKVSRPSRRNLFECACFSGNFG